MPLGRVTTQLWGFDQTRIIYSVDNLQWDASILNSNVTRLRVLVSALDVPDRGGRVQHRGISRARQ